jgi:hypothetical protein
VSLSQRQRQFLALVLAAILAGALPALAHPFGSDYFSLRTALRLTPAGLECVVVAEVPAQLVLNAFVRELGVRETYPDAEVERFMGRYFERLGSGLTLRVAGQALAGRWARLDDPKNGKMGEGFFVFMVRFIPDEPPALDAATLEVTVENDAWSDEKVLYSGSAEAHPPWRVRSSTAEELLGEIPEDVDYNTCYECWTDEEALRDLDVVFARGG